MEVVVVAFLCDLFGNDSLRQGLEIRVKAGVDTVALAIADRVDVELAAQGLDHVVDEVRRLDQVARGRHRQFFGIGGRCLRRRDVLRVDHRLEHLGLPAFRRLRVEHRAVLGGCLGEARHHGRLSQGDVVGVALEEAAGG